MNGAVCWAVVSFRRTFLLLLVCLSVLCCRSGVRVIFGQWRVQPYEQRRPPPAISIEAYDRVDRYFSFSTMISQRPMITISMITVSSPRAEVYYGEWWSAGYYYCFVFFSLFVDGLWYFYGLAEGGAERRYYQGAASATGRVHFHREGSGCGVKDHAPSRALRFCAASGVLFFSSWSCRLPR